MLQPDFLTETVMLLDIHKAIQTGGYCSPEIFRKIIALFDFVLFDIKHTDPVKHKLYTGVDKYPDFKQPYFFENFINPFCCTHPLVEGINDDNENLRNTAALLSGAKNLVRVELLPYNAAAPAKYPMVNKSFDYSFKAPLQIATDVFEQYDIEVRIL